MTFFSKIAFPTFHGYQHLVQDCFYKPTGQLIRQLHTTTLSVESSMKALCKAAFSSHSKGTFIHSERFKFIQPMNKDLNAKPSIMHFLEQKDEMGRTALYYAVSSGEYDIVKGLLDRGANLYVLDNRNRTLVHALVCNSSAKHPLCWKMLLTHFSKEWINRKDAQGNTPLYYAILQSNQEAVATLLQAGSAMKDIGASENSAYDFAHKMVEMWKQAHDLYDTPRTAEAFFAASFVLKTIQKAI